MEDPRENRRIAKNWREYLAESQETFRVYGWAWKEFITPESRRWMKRGVVLLLAGTVLNMAQPWLIRSVIDGLIEGQWRAVVTAIVLITGVMVADRLIFWLFDRCREYSLGMDIGQVDNRSTELFFEKSLSQHIQDDGLLSAANVEKGRNHVIQTEHMMVYEGVPMLAQLALAFIFLFIISPFSGLVMLVVLVVYLIFLLWINTKVLQVCTPIEKDWRKFNRHRVERWDNIERVKTSGKEAAELRFMTGFFDDIIRRDRRFWLWVIRMGTLRGLFSILVTCGLLGYGAWRVYLGDWTVGLLYPFYQWMRQIGDNLWRISHLERRLNWSMPSVRSMMQALTMRPDVEDCAAPAALRPDRTPRVEFRDVSHAYGKNGNGDRRQLHVLRDVSFVIEPGEKVALIGASGAGKTTVMRLLQRYTDPERGQVLVDDVDLREVRLNDWRQLVGYVPQQAQVLDGTLRYNLLYGLSDEERARVTDEDLWSLMRRLQIDFGERLIDGLDTVVGRRGIKLSGGQAQRLMIGAAVMKRPRLLIVDEATSSLDSTTEKQVQEGLTAVLESRTSALIIAHRLSTVRDLCTKFIVLRPAEETGDGGDQVEAVALSFEELHEISPSFRRLSADQGVIIDGRP